MARRQESKWFSKLTNKLVNIFDDFIVFMQSHKINNFVNSPKIEEQFNLSGSEVRGLVNYARRSGYPIGNTIKEGERVTKCYFWAESWDELKPTIEDLENRRNDLSTTIAELRKKFNQYDSPTLF